MPWPDPASNKTIIRALSSIVLALGIHQVKFTIPFDIL